MQYKKEACRNFQRGSCQYGERCKFLHVSQPQQKANAFGFGTQTGSTQQHKPNPFGFGVQSNPQSKGAYEYASRQNQFKPFENKWTRFSPVPNAASPSVSQPDSANHKCTDREACKRLILEDFEHERPLWNLTCYSHCKNSPCDIVGDISYEELRAAAYDDASRGLSLPSIVEREKNLLSAKLVEFENLVRNPYAVQPNSLPAGQSSFPATNPIASPLSDKKNVPPTVSSFSQLGSSPNMGFGVRSSALANNAFGQSNAFPNANQHSGAFGMNNPAIGSAGSFGSQLPAQTFGSSITSISGFSNSDSINRGSDSFPTVPLSTQVFGSTTSMLPDEPNFASKPDGQATLSMQMVNNLQRTNVSEDASIWLKEKWSPGEIPEEAPPEAFVF